MDRVREEERKKARGKRGRRKRGMGSRRGIRTCYFSGRKKDGKERRSRDGNGIEQKKGKHIVRGRKRGIV